MIKSLLCVVIYFLWIICPQNVFAHRVNVFAYVDGNELLIECSYGSGRFVRHGKITIYDIETKKEIHSAYTDEKGMYKYSIDTKRVHPKHDLLIVLNAGEGHRAEWRIQSSELQNLNNATQKMPVARPDISPSILDIVLGIIAILGIFFTLAFIKRKLK